MLTLVAVAFIYWTGKVEGALLAVAAIAISLFCGVPIAISQACLNLTTPRSEQEDVSDKEGDALYQLWASFTIAKPKEIYCWFRFLLDLVFLFLWPMVGLYTEGLPKYGTLFLGMGIFSGFRVYFDAR